MRHKVKKEKPIIPSIAVGVAEPESPAAVSLSEPIVEQTVAQSPPAQPLKRSTSPRNKYLTHVAPRLETILAWRRQGLIEKEICKNLGVSVSTFATYKNQHPEVLQVLKGGKADADAQVENALFKRAVGYEYTETKNIAGIGPEGPVARDETTNKQMAPDVIAQIFYLKNRCSDRWRDRSEHGLSGPNGEPLSLAEVVIYLPDNGRDKADAGAEINKAAGRQDSTLTTGTEGTHKQEDTAPHKACRDKHAVSLPNEGIGNGG